jgi:hypothetical protein
MSDYFDIRLALFFGRASLALPPRQPVGADGKVRGGPAMPELANGARPPPLLGHAPDRLPRSTDQGG